MSDTNQSALLEVLHIKVWATTPSVSPSGNPLFSMRQQLGLSATHKNTNDQYRLSSTESWQVFDGDANMVLQSVIFDLVGTLLYYGEATGNLITLGHQALTDYLVGEGLDVEFEDVGRVGNGIYEVYLPFAEKSLIELEARVLYQAMLYQLGIDDYSNEDLIAGAIRSFYSPIVDGYQIYSDVREVLGRLKGRGLKLGLITNNDSADFSDRLLQKFGLNRFFDSIVVSAKIGLRKPHKHMFLHWLKELDVSNEDSIYVGDHPIHDIQGAKNAQIKCIWVKRKEYADIPTTPDWTVESISQAEQIINKERMRRK